MASECSFKADELHYHHRNERSIFHSPRLENFSTLETGMKPMVKMFSPSELKKKILTRLLNAHYSEPSTRQGNNNIKKSSKIRTQKTKVVENLVSRAQRCAQRF